MNNMYKSKSPSKWLLGFYLVCIIFLSIFPYSTESLRPLPMSTFYGKKYEDIFWRYEDPAPIVTVLIVYTKQLLNDNLIIIK